MLLQKTININLNRLLDFDWENNALANMGKGNFSVVLQFFMHFFRRSFSLHQKSKKHRSFEFCIQAF